MEYKKYLIRAQYSNLKLAVDDCIFLFFLNYDKYMRKLLKNNIKEYDISALYEIFFATFDAKNFNISQILERHKNKVPTIFKENQRIDTKIMTLRAGLSEIIKKDYERSVNPIREKLDIIELDGIGIIEVPAEVFNQIKAGVVTPMNGLKSVGFSDMHLQELFELNGISEKEEVVIRNASRPRTAARPVSPG